MATATELILNCQVEHLLENARLHSWFFDRVDVTTFVLGMTAKDGSDFSLRTRCDGYAATPPAWHWYNRETEAIDSPYDTPLGGRFFHSAGVICAPWNRLAYKSVDQRGPHGNWEIGNWMNIKETGGTHTLASMAERIAHEFMVSYTNRMGA